jgi:hypothetical protein
MVDGQLHTGSVVLAAPFASAGFWVLLKLFHRHLEASSLN